MKKFLALAALVSLAACLAAPALYVWGSVGRSAYHLAFLVASACWFGAASGWAMSQHLQLRPAVCKLWKRFLRSHPE